MTFLVSFAFQPPTQDSSRYRYLFVQLDHYPRETVIIEDNRSAVDEDTSNQSLNDLRLS